MANLGTDISVEDLRCENCGAAIEATFIAHGDSRQGLSEAMTALSALARAAVHAYYTTTGAPVLCQKCAPPKPPSEFQQRLRRRMQHRVD
jgi:Fe-S-cluster-containing hydrogenase component 2